MKFGLQPFLNLKSYSIALEFAERNGFSCVEFHMDIPQFSYFQTDWKDVRDVISSYSTEVLFHASSAHTNLISPNPHIRKASLTDLRETAVFAEKTGGSLVTFHLGWSPVFMVDGKAVSLENKLRDLNFKAVLSIKEIIDEYPILAVENTIGLEGEILKALEELLDNTELRITYDIGHSLLDPSHRFFLDYFKKIVNVHIHDNDGKFDSHLIPGEGIFRPEVFPFKKYKGWIVFEVRPEQKCVIAKEKFLKML